MSDDTSTTDSHTKKHGDSIPRISRGQVHSFQPELPQSSTRADSDPVLIIVTKDEVRAKKFSKALAQKSQLDVVWYNGNYYHVLEKSSFVHADKPTHKHRVYIKDVETVSESSVNLDEKHPVVPISDRLVDPFCVPNGAIKISPNAPRYNVTIGNKTLFVPLLSSYLEDAAIDWHAVARSNKPVTTLRELNTNKGSNLSTDSQSESAAVRLANATSGYSWLSLFLTTAVLFTIVVAPAFYYNDWYTLLIPRSVDKPVELSTDKGLILYPNTNHFLQPFRYASAYTHLTYETVKKYLLETYYEVSSSVRDGYDYLLADIERLLRLVKKDAKIVSRTVHNFEQSISADYSAITSKAGGLGKKIAGEAQRLRKAGKSEAGVISSKYSAEARSIVSRLARAKDAIASEEQKLSSKAVSEGAKFASKMAPMKSSISSEEEKLASVVSADASSFTSKIVSGAKALASELSQVKNSIDQQEQKLSSNAASEGAKFSSKVARLRSSISKEESEVSSVLSAGAATVTGKFAAAAQKVLNAFTGEERKLSSKASVFSKSVEKLASSASASEASVTRKAVAGAKAIASQFASAQKSISQEESRLSANAASVGADFASKMAPLRSSISKEELSLSSVIGAGVATATGRAASGLNKVVAAFTGEEKKIASKAYDFNKSVREAVKAASASEKAWLQQISSNLKVATPTSTLSTVTSTSTTTEIVTEEIRVVDIEADQIHVLA